VPLLSHLTEIVLQYKVTDHGLRNSTGGLSNLHTNSSKLRKLSFKGLLTKTQRVSCFDVYFYLHKQNQDDVQFVADQ
jgi:hypothetical protein